MTRMRALWLAAAVVIVAAAIGALVGSWVDRTEVECGVVIDIEQVSITDVRSFSIRTPDGVTHTFRIVPGRLAPSALVPGHLREHRALAAPVCVTFRPAESPAVALDIEDGPEDAGSPPP